MVENENNVLVQEQIIIGSLSRSDSKAAKRQSDKEFLQETIKLEEDVQSELDNVTAEMHALNRKYSSSQGLRDRDSFEKELLLALTVFFLFLGNRVAQTSVAVARSKANLATSKVIPLLNNNKAFDAARELRVITRGYALNMEKSIWTRRTYGSTFAHRIKTIRAGTEKTVRNIITLGVKNGLSTDEMALRIEQYLNPIPGGSKAKPFDIYRQRFGRPRSFTPPGVPAGTVQYNAIRIARTESATTYRNATLDFYTNNEGNPHWYIEGFKKVLSNSHPKLDICDDQSKEIYRTREDVPEEHPNGLCDVVPVLRKASDIRAISSRLANGEAINTILRSLK